MMIGVRFKMDAAAILQRARQLGITIVLDCDRLRYNPRGKAPAELVEAIRENKPEIIKLLGQENSIGALPVGDRGVIQDSVGSSSGCRNSFTPHSSH